MHHYLYKFWIIRQNRYKVTRRGDEMSSLAKLSDVLLVDTYTKAVAIQVDPDFIHYLIVEIRRRGLDLVIEEKNKLEMSVQ